MPTDEPTDLSRRRRGSPRKRVLLTLAAPTLLSGLACSTASTTSSPATGNTPDVVALLADGRSLDGSGNNATDPTLGAAGTIYPRETTANYADGVGEMVGGPDARYLSNRIFNDTNQNIFNDAGITHWGFVWGQFIDHTIGMRESGDEDLVIPFDPDDALETFTNDLGGIAMTRSAAADGTGVDSPREQVNTVSSYIDGWAVYGGSDERLDWLREGPADGDPTNNDATLLNVDGYLPTAAARPDTETPDVDLMGQLFGDPSAAVIAGDVRVNENIGLTAVQTLFLREHNRIVDELPDDLDEQTKFEIARRVVGALQQYITYNEFLPSMGVALDEYAGYDPTVDPSMTNEFATIGYRAHSQIHGEFEAEIPLDQLTDDLAVTLENEGVEVTLDDDVAEVAIPLNVAFGNPDLVAQIGLGNLLTGLASEAQYANDEQIDNQLRSVLFQIPGPDVENPSDCLDGAAIADCFSGVNDLGALDVMRGYDHGMPTYNDLREAYGLPRITSFAELTGESTAEFPNDPAIDAFDPIDDPSILDFVYLADADGNRLDPDTDAATTSAVTGIRRTTTAARLAAIFGDVDDVDAFTGMISEPHVSGTQFGELQLAMWQRQFEALRDGDRFFYGNDPALDEIADLYGIDYRRSLADVIEANTDADPTEFGSSAFILAVPTVATTDGTADAATDPTTGGTGAESTIQPAPDDPRPADPQDRPRHRAGDTGDPPAADRPGRGDPDTGRRRRG